MVSWPSGHQVGRRGHSGLVGFAHAPDLAASLLCGLGIGDAVDVGDLQAVLTTFLASDSDWPATTALAAADTFELWARRAVRLSSANLTLRIPMTDCLQRPESCRSSATAADLPVRVALSGFESWR
jgi:hypothetical protein